MSAVLTAVLAAMGIECGVERNWDFHWEQRQALYPMSPPASATDFHPQPWPPFLAQEMRLAGLSAVQCPPLLLLVPPQLVLLVPPAAVLLLVPPAAVLPAALPAALLPPM